MTRRKRELRYTKFVAAWVRPEQQQRLYEIASEKGYRSKSKALRDAINHYLNDYAKSSKAA